MPRCLLRMGVVSWLVLGALVGLVVHARIEERFPGGIAGTVSAGTAGAFLGGGIFSLVAHRATSRVDVAALVTAVVGSRLILAATRSAGHAEPGPR
jgi:uncharacterized membrane protein YeaQ/YmgE (transglycosylase-associated protein family)